MVFGANMTSLTLHVARSIGRSTFKKGDNIVVTDLDHDANVTSWVDVANELVCC